MANKSSFSAKCSVRDISLLNQLCDPAVGQNWAKLMQSNYDRKVFFFLL